MLQKPKPGEVQGDSLVTQIDSWGLPHLPRATSGAVQAVGCSSGCTSSQVVLEFVTYLNKTRDHLVPLYPKSLGQPLEYMNKHVLEGRGKENDPWWRWAVNCTML